MLHTISLRLSIGTRDVASLSTIPSWVPTFPNDLRNHTYTADSFISVHNVILIEEHIKFSELRHTQIL